MPCKTAKTFGPCTLNNYTVDDIEWLERLECNVMVCSEERGEGGTPHLQFSVTFKRSYSYAALHKLHPRISWREQECKQDMNYCRKRDSKLIIDRDERKRKGARTDIDEARDTARNTASMRAVVETARSMQAVQIAEKWLVYNEPKRPLGLPIEVHWRYGGPGIGKTRPVWDKYGESGLFTPTTYKWWQGYDGHHVVLIDEFRGDWCKLRELLILLDVYPYTVECKNGSRQIQARKWYITSCKCPWTVYKCETFDEQEKVDQLVRRCTSILHIGIDEDPLLSSVDQ